MIKVVNLLNLIRRYPLITFFILTFTFSWILFLIYILNPNEVSILLIILAIYAPAYTALIISKITGNKQNNNKTRVKWVIFLIIWVIATFTFIFNYFMQVGNLPLFIIVGSIFLGLLPAFITASGFSQNLDIRAVFRSYIKPKGHFGWYLFAILYLPVVFLIGIAITLRFDQPVVWISLPIGVELVGLIILTFLYTFFFGAGTMKNLGGVVLHYPNYN